MHFYEFFKLYAPEKDFQTFSIDIIYCSEYFFIDIKENIFIDFYTL